MAKFITGNVVVVNFPYTDLSATKRRPALVIADGDYNDLVLCQITSQKPKNNYYITLGKEDLDQGQLPVNPSFIRYRMLFTLNRRLIIRKAGFVSKEIAHQTIKAIEKWLKMGINGL